MNQYNEEIFTQSVKENQPPNPVKQIKKCYNWACASLLFQFLIANAISLIGSFIYSTVLTVQLMAKENITDTVELTEKVMDSMDPAFVILLTAVSYLTANLISCLIGNAATKKLYRARIFGGIKLPAADCGLCIAAILGLQGLSMIVQLIVTNITQMSGIDSETAAMFSFSDDAARNIILILYTVVIAAFTEELLCRGVVMKLLSPVSSRFALVVSALLFGLMHGNFNQIFNGFLLGLVLGYAALKSKSVWMSVICHMAANTNAMILSFLEYKIGEDFFIAEIVYAVVLIFVGAAAIFLLYKRNGRVDDSCDRFPAESSFAVEGCNTKQLKWKLLIASPCFWIFTAIYLVTAIVMLTPLASV